MTQIATFSFSIIPRRILVCLVAGSFALAAARAEPSPQGEVDGRLGWFAEKLRRKEPVRIGFIGGSITMGAGASKPYLGYANRTSSRLSAELVGRKTEPLKTVNAGVGGTGSRYGAFRVGPQILDKDVDLLVIEFAVNDDRASDAKDSLEGIVRQVWRAYPKMGIVVFCTTTAATEHNYYQKGELPPGAAAHKTVAEHYGIKVLMAGPAAHEKFAGGEFGVDEFFKDGVHPSDLGHQFYADILAEALISALSSPTPHAEPEPLPSLLGSGEFEWAGMAPIKPIGSTEGWTQAPSNYLHPYGRWTSTTPEAKLRFAVNGSRVGLLSQKIDSATIKVDDGDGVKWTMPGRSDGIPTHRFLPEDGKRGAHIIEVTAQPGKSGEVSIQISGVVFIRPPSE